MTLHDSEMTLNGIPADLSRDVWLAVLVGKKVVFQNTPKWQLRGKPLVCRTENRTNTSIIKLKHYDRISVTPREISLMIERKPYPPTWAGSSELESQHRAHLSRLDPDYDWRIIVLADDLDIPGYSLPESNPDVQVLLLPWDQAPNEYFWPVAGRRVVTCMFGGDLNHRPLVAELLAYKASEVISLVFDPDLYEPPGLGVVDMATLPEILQVPVGVAARAVLCFAVPRYHHDSTCLNSFFHF